MPRPTLGLLAATRLLLLTTSRYQTVQHLTITE